MVLWLPFRATNNIMPGAGCYACALGVQIYVSLQAFVMFVLGSVLFFTPLLYSMLPKPHCGGFVNAAEWCYRKTRPVVHAIYCVVFAFTMLK